VIIGGTIDPSPHICLVVTYCVICYSSISPTGNSTTGSNLAYHYVVGDNVVLDRWSTIFKTIDSSTIGNTRRNFTSLAVGNRKALEYCIASFSAVEEDSTAELRIDRLAAVDDRQMGALFALHGDRLADEVDVFYVIVPIGCAILSASVFRVARFFSFHQAEGILLPPQVECFDIVFDIF